MNLMQTAEISDASGMEAASDGQSVARAAFRYDINGLRAWAVLPVVLYHFGIPGFHGGFVGVDVFFVISGFLMTGIVTSALERGRFSPLGFYLARAARIVPALLVVCLALLALGWFWLVAIEYRTLDLQIATAVMFFSNLLFWKSAGYFDTASHEKWLLHTWSLSVEWQFYLLLPLLVVLAWRWQREAGLRTVLAGAALASFGWSIYASSRWPDAAFYLLPARGWELLIGGLVWLYGRRREIPASLAVVLESAGLALIVLAAVSFDATLRWPGGLAAVPVLGAALVIAAARQRSPFTGNGVAQWLGSRSYSIYLWHWPASVLLVYAGLQHDPVGIVCGVAASLMLGEASYQLVETPSRAGLARLRRRGRLVCLGAAIMTVTLAAVAARYQHVPNRIPPLWDFVANEHSDYNPTRNACLAYSGTTSPACVHGHGPIRAIVLGDSHANALLTAVQGALPPGADAVLELTYSGCPTLYGAHPVPSVDSADMHCGQFNDWALRKVATLDRAIPVFVINRTSDYAYGPIGDSAQSNHPLVYFSNVHDRPDPAFLAEFAQHLVDAACTLAKLHPVYMVRPVPEMPFDVPATMTRQLMFKRGTSELSISLDDYLKRNAMVWRAQDTAAAQCGVHVLDPLPTLCSSGRCWATDHLRPLYFDADHFSEYGDERLVPMFRAAFE
jgi:peptidoglycan/LPS O-acetylase OafA/YrhL